MERSDTEYNAKVRELYYRYGALLIFDEVVTAFRIGLSGAQGSLKQIKIRKHMMEEMGAAYMAEGIVTLAGSRMYTSMADTFEVIDDALTRFARVFQNIEGIN